MKTFYYNNELLQKMNSVTKPTVFALDLGLGKTQTLYEYINTVKNKKILVVVNNIAQLQEMNDIFENHISIWHSKVNYNFESIMKGSIIAITKQKFFQLLLHEKYMFLNSFDEYFYDEFSGLSPIAATEILNDLSSIYSDLKYRGGNEQNIEFLKRISDLFMNLVLEINKSNYEDNIVYNIPLSNEIKGRADDILSEYLKYIQEPNPKIHMLNIMLIIMLKAIIHSDIYMSKYRTHKTVKYPLVIKNNLLKDFIQHKKFIVLDATAQLNKEDYNYLNIQIDYKFSANNDTYDNLTLYSHRIGNIKKQNIRNGSKKALDKIVQYIPHGKKIVHTFSTLDAKEPLINTFGFLEGKLYYFFSGNDIGSNTFRDVTELNIICTQTYPKILRVVYNHIIYGYDLSDANHNDHDKAEWNMITRDLIQLIGRTAIRKHEHIPVCVNIYQVEDIYFQLMKETHFTDVTIIYEQHENPPNRGVKDQLLTLIEARLENNNNKRDIIYIEDLISSHYTNERSRQRFISKNLNDIRQIAKNYNMNCIKVYGKTPYFTKNEKNDTSIKESSMEVPDLPNNLVQEQQSIYITQITTQHDFDTIIASLHDVITKTSEFMRTYSVSRYKLKKFIHASSDNISIKGHYLHINTL